MADDRRPPSRLEERISQLGAPHKRAVPPTYPGHIGRLGMGKQPIPPKAPPPLPVAHPVRGEPTKVTDWTQPAPGSQGPEKRSFTPTPAASERELRAIEREAQSEGARVVAAPESTTGAYSTVPRRVEYGIEAGTRNWLIALATLLFGTSGVAIYGAVKDPPPAVQEAPKRVEDNEREARRLRIDLNECRSDVRELESKQDRHDDRIDSLERKFYDLDKRTPKVNP
jgi:hypothetical protein